jgi:hypothetical protein
MKRDKDYIAELVVYLKKNLKKGYTKDSLRWALVNQGHSKLEVEKAIKKLEEELAANAPVLNTKPVITYELVEPKTQTKKKKPFWKRFFR